MSMLTTSESAASLKMMADGLMQRYRDARKTPSQVLYTDRDCCSVGGSSKNLFEEWGEGQHVHLDIWHFLQNDVL